MAYEPTILQSGFVMYIILPFLLIFTLVFAILQKSKILGDGKKQIDALVALSIALIVVAFSSQVEIIQELMPFLAIGLVILMIFFLFWAFAFPEGKFEVPKAIKYTIGIVAAIAVIIATLVTTGSWDTVKSWFTGDNSSVGANIIIVVIIIGVILAVVLGGKKPEDKKKDS